MRPGEQSRLIQRGMGRAGARWVAAAIETSPPWKPELPSMEFLESSSGSKEEKPWCSLAHMFGFNPGLIPPVREATCQELTFSLPRRSAGARYAQGGDRLQSFSSHPPPGPPRERGPSLHLTECLRARGFPVSLQTQGRMPSIDSINSVS